MNNRILALTGPLFTVLFVIALFVVPDDGPGGDATGAQIVDYYEEHESGALAGVFAAPLLVALLVVFFSQLRVLARERGAEAGAGPTVMVAGAVLWAAGLLLGSTVGLALIDASDKEKAEASEALNLLLGADWVPFIAGVAVTLIGAGMTVLRTQLLPTWLGWVALVVGIVSVLGPGGFLGFFVAPLWMLVAGLILYTRAPAPAAA